MPRKAQTKKTKAKEPFSKSVTLVLRERVHTAMKRRALDEGVTLQELVHRAISRVVDQPESLTSSN